MADTKDGPGAQRAAPPSSSDGDPGLDWLIEWAMAQDKQARDHYFHVNDGRTGSCGCRYQGEP